MKTNLPAITGQMTHIIQFPYTKPCGKQAQMEIARVEDWITLSPISTALFTKPNDRTKLGNYIKTNYEHQYLSIGRFRPVMFIRIRDLHNILNDIHIGNRQIHNHLLTHLVPFLQAEAEQPMPQTERVQMQSYYEPDYMTEQQALAHLRQSDTIHIDQEWNENDRLRLKINQLGVTDWDDVNYLAITYEGLIMLRLPRVDSDDRYEMWKIPMYRHRQYTVKFFRENGWDLAPVFFLKYPMLYQREVQYHIRAEISADGKTGKAVAALMGKGSATWYSKSFERRILGLQSAILKHQAEEAKWEEAKRRKYWREYFTNMINEQKAEQNVIQTSHP